jgi:hypothetical protein
MAAVLGAGTLIGRAFALRGEFVEWWWIRKLYSPDAAERRAAAEKLVDLRCLRAVPHLIAAVRRNQEEDIRHKTISVPNQEMSIDIVQVRFATPLLLALWKLGEPALDRIRAALARENQAGGNSDSRLVRLLEEFLAPDRPSFLPMP